jgi:hypothetical protein
MPASRERGQLPPDATEHAAGRCAGALLVTEVAGNGFVRVDAGRPAAQCREFRVVREREGLWMTRIGLTRFHDGQFDSISTLD